MYKFYHSNTNRDRIRRLIAPDDFFRYQNKRTFKLEAMKISVVIQTYNSEQFFGTGTEFGERIR